MKTFTFTKLEKPYVKLSSGKVKEKFYNKEMNNLMVFDPHRGSNVDEVLGYTTERRYDFVMEKLNTETGIIVEWYKCEDTTSDYNIYYGLDVESIAHKPFYEIMKTLNAERGNEVKGYKFNEIRNGICTPASFIEVK
ncbi:hypothetical protein CN988_00900 [Bacillus thuringiensis]|uniref:hypothetical protein n=1 Tax=Bacillus thuringiensis TaxID=1428 RepID=UPI000BFBC1C9|nr:hypothetical protein [Bacillus thuringiensis]PGO90172.1 hypothetical protein CN988_00900 [Bacillus thuringiensis]